MGNALDRLFNFCNSKKYLTFAGPMVKDQCNAYFVMKNGPYKCSVNVYNAAKLCQYCYEIGVSAVQTLPGAPASLSSAGGIDDDLRGEWRPHSDRGGCCPLIHLTPFPRLVSPPSFVCRRTVHQYHRRQVRGQWPKLQEGRSFTPGRAFRTIGERRSDDDSHQHLRGGRRLRGSYFSSQCRHRCTRPPDHHGHRQRERRGNWKRLHGP